MYLLIEFEPLELVWTDQWDTWKQLLKDNKFCSVTRYQQFKLATRYFSRGEFESLGVGACVIIARTPKAHFSVVKTMAKEYQKEHGVPLTPSKASSLIREVSPSSDSRANHRLSVRKLGRHVRHLEAVLLQHEIQPPKFEEQTETDQTELDAAVALVRAKMQLKANYPSCSDAELVRLATSQVSAASASLRHALRKPGKPVEMAPKGNPKNLRTSYTDGEMDGMVRVLELSDLPVISGADVISRFRSEMHPSSMSSIQSHVRRRLRASKTLTEAGKVGSSLVFRRKRSRKKSKK